MPNHAAKFRVKPRPSFRVAGVDPRSVEHAPGGKEKTLAATEELVVRIAELQELLFAGQQHKVLVVLQGMDTSGKDGTLRCVMRDVSPQGVRVASFKKPTTTELEHDYLWRIHAQAPATGEIAVFNRSHYEDVLVVRVHSLVPASVWKKRYDQINDFERMLSECGVTILKFFLHISAEEQKERLQARLDDPTKRWKFQHGDLAERKLWGDYMRAYEEAIAKTSTAWAPWYAIPSDRKWIRNWAVAGVVAETLEGLRMKYPQPGGLDGVVVE